MMRTLSGVSLKYLACLVLIALVSCSPDADEDTESKTAHAEAGQSTTEATDPKTLIKDQIADKALNGGLTPGPSTAQPDRAMIEGVTTAFDEGLVTACIQMRAKVGSMTAGELNESVAIEPQVTNARLMVKEGQICAKGLESQKTYTFKLAPGIVLIGGQKTTSELEAVAFASDLPSALGFKSKGFVLAKGSATGVEVVTTNISDVRLELVRVPERSVGQVIDRMRSGETAINRWELRSLLNELAAPVWEGSVRVKGFKNDTVSTVLPIQNMLQALPQGAFALMAADASDSGALLPSTIFDPESKHDSDDRANVQWLLNTNIATSAALYEKGMLVSVLALDTARPVEGAQVELVTVNNDVVFQGVTGADGGVLLPEPAVRGKRANAPSHVVVRYGSDFSWVGVKSAALDLSDLDVGGRQVSGEQDAYLFTDRGIYRPGETVYVSGLIRDLQGRMGKSGAVDLLVYRPNGSLYEKQPLILVKLDSFTRTVRLPNDAPRGAWRFTLASSTHDDIEFGNAEIDVQDFVPERLKVEARTEKDTIAPGEALGLDVVASFLYGAPGSDLGIEAEAVVRSLKDSDKARLGIEGYLFGDVLSDFVAPRLRGTHSRTDVDGRGAVVFGSWDAVFPQGGDYGSATQPVTADISVGVQEPGGRTTKAQASLTLLPGQDVLGLKAAFDGAVDNSVGAQFSVRRLSADLQPVPVGTLWWEVSRLKSNWYYDRSAERWNSEYRISRHIVAQGSVIGDNAQKLTGLIDLEPLEWGRYAITVFDKNARVYTRQTFYSGWSSNVSGSAPDFLEVKAASKQFTPGEEIELGVESPFDGYASVVTWSNGLQHRQGLSLKKGANKVVVKTEDHWFPGAQFMVTAFRPLHSESAPSGTNPLSALRYMPVRAMGSIYLSSEGGQRLDVSLPPTVPMAPRLKQPLQISVPALKGKTGFVLAQAVEQGILQLTRFKTPSPEDYFFAKRALGVTYYDDYNKLLRADGAIGEIKTGGDAASPGGNSLPVVPTKSVVVFAGPVALDAKGNATVLVDVPDFNGTLRVMATVWSADAYGSADAYWVVRDPLMVDAVFPRYLAPGDESRVAVIVANTTDEPMTVALTATTSGSIALTPDAARSLDALSQTVLQPGERRQLSLGMNATDHGLGTLSLEMSNDSGFSYVRDWSIYSRYAGHNAAVSSPTVNIAGNQSGMVDFAFMETMQTKGRTGYLTISDQTSLDAAKALTQLLQYPWTCSEQTVSRADPVMKAYAVDPEFVERMAKSALHGTTLREWLQANVDRIISRQGSDGSIGLWRQGDDLVDPMLSTALVDFLVTASLAGFTVPPQAVSNAYDWSYRLILDSTDSEARKLEALSALVKAISPYSGKAIRLARSLAEEAGQADVVTLSNLAVALTRLGDPDRARDLLKTAITDQQVISASSMPYYRGQWSIHAEYAENLYLLGEVTEGDKVVNLMHTKLNPQHTWWNVHDSGLAVRVAAAKATKSHLVVEVDGLQYQSRLGSIGVDLPADVLDGIRNKMSIVSRSGRALRANAFVSAPPKLGVELSSEDWGFRVNKRFYDFAGGELLPDTSPIKVNDRIVVLVEATRPNNRYRTMQTMVKDPVVAGFQIESVITPTQQREVYRWLPRLTRTDVSETRDDAFFAANLMSWSSNDTFRVAYVMRATTPGRYLAAQAVVENMYLPSDYGLSDARSIEVIAE